MHASPTLEQDRDGHAVALLADFLEVSEFEVFAAAFRAWYRCDAGAQDLERHFGTYLREGRVPFWVRDFARKRLRSLGIDPNEGEVDLGVALGLALELLAPGLRARLARILAPRGLLA